MVFELLVSVRLGRFMECRGVLLTTQFAYNKGLDTCDVLLCVAPTLQSALEMGHEDRIVQIDVSAAFDKVDHQGALFKLCSVEVGGSVLSVLTQFLFNRSQYVVVDGCRSKMVNVVSGAPQGMFWACCCSSCTLELYSVVENKLVAGVPSPGERVAVSESMNRDLNRVSVWRNLWGMKLNASKTKTMIVSMSGTIHPQLTPIDSRWNCAEGVC